MKLILTADVANLGGPGDIVEVKDGYGRNFLLPRGLAIVATRGAEKQVDTIRRTQEGKRIRDLDHAKEVAGQIGASAPSRSAARPARAGASSARSPRPTSSRPCAPQGGPNLDKRFVAISGHIKSTGDHQVTVRLHPDVAVDLALDVQGG